MTNTSRLDAARLFGGDTSPYGQENAEQRGVFANYPASYPKYNLSGTLAGTLETGLRLYLPVSELLKQNPKDKDILIPLANSRYIEVIATDMQITLGERVEVKETVNGSFATYYYGMSPGQISLAGHLLNDFQNDWRNAFLRVYTQYIRGSMLAKQGKRLVISYEDLVLVCECTNFSFGANSMGETHNQFNLTAILKSMTVKINPRISDLNTKDAALIGSSLDTSSAASTKTTTQAGVKGSSTKDVFNQNTMASSEINAKVASLEQNKANLKATEAAVQVRLSDAQRAYDLYFRNSGGAAANPFDSEGLELLARVKSAQNDLDSVRRQISDVDGNIAFLKGNTLKRDENTRSGNASQSNIPKRVVKLGVEKKAAVNKNIPQTAG